MAVTTSPTGRAGAARATVFTVFLSLTDPVVPFAPEGGDRDAARDAPRPAPGVEAAPPPAPSPSTG